MQVTRCLLFAEVKGTTARDDVTAMGIEMAVENWKGMKCCKKKTALVVEY